MDVYIDAIITIVYHLADIRKAFSDNFDFLITALKSSTGYISTEFTKHKLLTGFLRSSDSQF